jgi:FHS family L-fucose permease-like MFS transporter
MNTKNNIIGVAVIGILFFTFGFITWSNAQLIPYLKIACQLTPTQSYYVATAFFAAYFLTSYPASIILSRIGYKKGMSLGLLIMSIGAFLFIPAAKVVSFPYFLTALFIIGTGLAMLQTAANPYVTVLGPIESAARRMSIMGICNKVAGIISVYALGSIILKDADNWNEKIVLASSAEKISLMQSLASKVIFPYLIIGVVLFLLAVIILIIMPNVEAEKDNGIHDSIFNQYPIWKVKHLMLGALAIFFYVGVEVISYDTFSNLGVSLGYSLDTAKNFASYTGYMLLLGYIVGILAIPKFISQTLALIVSCILSILCILVAVIVVPSFHLPREIAVFAFAFLGFSNAAIWPAIWPLALNKVGKHTERGSALLVMGIVGGAVLPPVYGLISDFLNSPLKGYWMMVPCYLYILYFAVKGSKLTIGK